MKKLKTSQIEKNDWKGFAIVAFIESTALFIIYFLSKELFRELAHFPLILGFISFITFLISFYKFITFGKTYKWYRVINDTKKSHGMVNTYARHFGQAADQHVWVKDVKTETLYLCPEVDLKDATAEYITKKLEQDVLFFAGLTALVILAANVINEGHWSASVAFAIISFVCFTVYKLQKDEY